MKIYIEINELEAAKFHPLPYTHITPADVRDAESFKRGWNDALDAIIESAPKLRLVECDECAYGIEDDGWIYCHKYEQTETKDHFCADGVPKEERP